MRWGVWLLTKGNRLKGEGKERPEEDSNKVEVNDGSDSTESREDKEESEDECFHDYIIAKF